MGSGLGGARCTQDGDTPSAVLGELASPAGVWGRGEGGGEWGAGPGFAWTGRRAGVRVHTDRLWSLSFLT